MFVYIYVGSKINEKVGAGMAHLKNLFFDTHLLERYLDK